MAFTYFCAINTKMKKYFIAAAVAAMFVTTSVNAQSVNDNNNSTSVIDVVAELSQDDAIKFIPMYQKLLSEIESISKSVEKPL